jgi:hypothetical protein
MQSDDPSEMMESDLADGIESAAESSDQPNQARRSALISWVISGALHATIVMLMSTVYFLVQDEEQEIPPVRVQNIPPPPEKKEEKPKLERELLDPKVQLDIETKSDNPSPITPLDLPEDNSVSEEQNDNEVAKGREEAVASAETGGQGAFMAIGAGGGSAGMFGSRSGGGRKRAVGRGGGSKGSESAVEAALRWLKKHQSPNGMWDNTNFPRNCTEDPKCEPGYVGKHDGVEADMAMTGYAILCFLGAGYDHVTPNKYRDTVKRGITWLLANQKPDGLLGERNYEHPIATMALAEAYAMSNATDLRVPTQKAVDIILQRQNQDPKADAAYAGLGWDYSRPSSRNDASVTGWNIMALKSAYAAGINVKGGMDGAKNWLLQHWRASNASKGPGWEAKLDPYKDETGFAYTWTTGSTNHEGQGWEGRQLASVGMVCAVFLGHKSGDAMLETLANFAMNRQTPTSFPCNTYYLYYNTLGMFQVGGDKWQAWNATVRDMLINAQRKGDGCFDGSWDYAKAGPPNDYGRILSTVYCCLSLEVYYRYAQVNKGH